LRSGRDPVTSELNYGASKHARHKLFESVSIDTYMRLECGHSAVENLRPVPHQRFCKVLGGRWRPRNDRIFKPETEKRLQHGPNA